MTELLETVKKFGLNEYESKAYLALLKLDSATASTVSRTSLIPRARVYDVLASLEKKGFIEKRVSKPVSYFAFSPSVVAKTIGKQKKNLFDLELKEIFEVGNALEQHVSKEQQPVASTDEVRLVRGQQNIYLKIAQELENSSESVLFSSTSEGLERKKEEFKKKLSALSKKGVQVSFKESDLRFCVIDKKTLVLFLNPDSKNKTEDNALLIKNSFIADKFLGK